MREWGIVFLIVGIVALALGTQMGLLAIIAGAVMLAVSR